jgi:hypothetical protein
VLKFCTQSAFAARHGVTGQTVGKWARARLVKLAPDRRRVDIAASDVLLATRPRRGRGAAAPVAPAGASADGERSSPSSSAG